MHAIGKHLYQRKLGSTFYVMVDVPRHLRGHVLTERSTKPVKRLVQSLQTKDRSEAVRRGKSIEAGFRLKIEAAQAAWDTENKLKRTKQAEESSLRRAEKWRIQLRKAGLTPTPLAELTQMIAALPPGPMPPAAEQAAEQAIRAIVQGDVVSIEHMHDEWRSKVTAPPKTKVKTDLAVRRLVAWLGTQKRPPVPASISRRVAAEFKDALIAQGLKPEPTVRNLISRLGAVWKWAGKQGLIDEEAPNPWRGLDFPGATKGEADDATDVRGLTEAELKALFDGTPTVRKQVDQDLIDAMQIGFHTCMRIGEIGNLRVKDIDVEARTALVRPYTSVNGRKVRVKSAAAKRLLPIAAALWPTIERLIAGKAADAFVIFDKPDVDLRYSRVEKRFERWRDSKRLKNLPDGRVVFHSLRHSFYTLAQRAGVAKETRDYLMGHVGQSTGERFYFDGPGLDLTRQAVETIRLPAPVQEK